MKRIRYWLSSKRRQMAKLHDLQRQLQEAWDEKDKYKVALRKSRRQYGDLWDSHDGLKDQLHRVARERDKERKLRLAAEELRDVYLEQLENEEE